ncbi:hypothetical protein V6N13_094554 [Hibiscus sabdariffa]|uniref:Uncharacterized protein n=2 Tax=Hibiscus sabdariffa TaxID=183260 RepID=A0ABR2A0V9_9ROSI
MADKLMTDLAFSNNLHKNEVDLRHGHRVHPNGPLVTRILSNECGLKPNHNKNAREPLGLHYGQASNRATLGPSINESQSPVTALTIRTTPLPAKSIALEANSGLLKLALSQSLDAQTQ